MLLKEGNVEISTGECICPRREEGSVKGKKKKKNYGHDEGIVGGMNINW
jgi:hypothetical protein